MDDHEAKMSGLKAAAEWVAAYLRAASPSAKSAAAWYSYASHDAVFLRNKDLGAWATALDKRHPFWGEWTSSPKVATDWANPDRTGWDEKALELAATEAAEKFGDEWVSTIAQESDIWEET